MIIDIIVGVLAVIFVVFIIAKVIVEYKRRANSSLQCGNCSKCCKCYFKGVEIKDEKGE